MLTNPKKLLEENGLRVITCQAERSFGPDGPRAWCAWIHLNDFRFADWDKIDPVLNQAGFRIDDDHDGDVNEIRIVKR